MLKAIDYKDNKAIKNDLMDLVHEAFPPEEVPTKHGLLKRAMCKNVHFLAFYDQSEFIGLTYYVVSEKHVYLFLLAVKKEKRNNHYGEKLINYVKRENPRKIMVLTYEEVNPKYEDNDMRMRRANFYLRNNIFPTTLKVKEFGIVYLVASSVKDLKLDIKTYKKITKPSVGYFLPMFFVKEYKD